MIIGRDTWAVQDPATASTASGSPREESLPFIRHVCGLGEGDTGGTKGREGGKGGGREGETDDREGIETRVFPSDDFRCGLRAGMPSGTARINGTPKIVLAISLAAQ